MSQPSLKVNLLRRSEKLAAGTVKPIGTGLTKDDEEEEEGRREGEGEGGRRGDEDNDDDRGNSIRR